MPRFLLVVLAILAGLTAASAEPVFPPGARIGLEPPSGMVVSRRFVGFEDVDNKAGISVVEVPLPASNSVENSMFDTPPNLNSPKREMFGFADGVGILVTGTMEVEGAPVHRWYLLARTINSSNADFAAFITVNVPDSALGVYTDKAVRAALATVSFRPNPLDEQVKLLPFKLGDLAGFRIIQAFAAGGLIITDGPTNDITRQPYMLVSIGPGVTAEDSDQRQRIARDLLSSAPLSEMTITSAESMRISNLPVIEIRATAKNLRGDPVKLVQWVRFGAGGFIRIVGVVGENGWDQMFDRFRAVRDGVEVR
jgi:hypothetical protein